ncbi:TIGR01457 family HAD-type hydrolase [Bombilactobacillus thymidiniphilus]|uniref:TIGR01457 family HAD-type hydrolase n=1 Tax=Bombilactobacillus thymidiniphilus TaxID=2923363 RepID=A0ABY4PEE2_9LACO|nr:TIGR01457 family HAD-type hydrolase [Bombilactobacillus thymidiniphilus]UQS83874.1 TIGR01457 family HAD-type hydrolase [Bombilactobacillus thymidiniphilus]
MKHYQSYLIDLDGTIYLGKDKIPAASSFITQLQTQKIPFAFLTNNSTKTPQQVVANLAMNHDIKVEPQQIITPSDATAEFIKQQNAKSCYVIGEQGLKTAIYNQGIEYNEINPDFVVVGLDTDVTYHKFEVATLAIKRGSKFIGTNADTNLPNERGLVPGAGSVISMVETATQQKAIYIGKPERFIADYALEKLHWQRSTTAIIGDNYHTDIECGLNASIDTILVYTGVSTKEQVAQFKQQPTYQIDSLHEWSL